MLRYFVIILSARAHVTKSESMKNYFGSTLKCCLILYIILDLSLDFNVGNDVTLLSHEMPQSFQSANVDLNFSFSS